MYESEQLKTEVKQYWDSSPCGTTHASSVESKGEGSIEFFERIENQRYNLEPFIHSFAQFTACRGKRVLEVGCGIGTDLLQFARAGAKIYGIDLSRRSIEFAKRRLDLYGLNAELLEIADAENLPFCSDKFDLVYSWGVVHHTPNTERAVKEMYRVLKPGGFIKVMIYHRISLVVLRLYIRYGILKGKPFTRISEIISKHMESPGTKAYTVGEAIKLFLMFSNVEINPILTPYDLRIVKNIFLPSQLTKAFPNRYGWFMLISGQKQE